MKENREMPWLVCLGYGTKYGQVEGVQNSENSVDVTCECYFTKVARDVFAVSMFIHPSKIFFVYTFIHTVLSERLLDFSWVLNIRTLLQTGV